MILVSKFMVHRVLSDKTYLSLGLLSPLSDIQIIKQGGPVLSVVKYKVSLVF